VTRSWDGATRSGGLCGMSGLALCLGTEEAALIRGLIRSQSRILGPPEPRCPSTASRSGLPVRAGKRKIANRANGPLCQRVLPSYKTYPLPPFSVSHPVDIGVIPQAGTGPPRTRATRCKTHQHRFRGGAVLAESRGFPSHPPRPVFIARCCRGPSAPIPAAVVRATLKSCGWHRDQQGSWSCF
jgi:hypothetical protein